MLVRIPHALLLRASIKSITNNTFCDLLERGQGQRVRDARQRQASAMVQEDSGEKEG